MKRTSIPYLLALAVLLGACSKNVLLDNPSSAAVTFTIDGTEVVEVAANSTAEVSISEGKHKVKVEGGGISSRDTSFSLREGGILHAGSSTYLIWRQLYGLQNDRATLLNERWVEFDSAKAFGDFKVFPPDVLFIEKTWDHGLEEPLPESKTLMISKDFAVESKIFRAKDFLETYKEMAGKAQ